MLVRWSLDDRRRGTRAEASRQRTSGGHAFSQVGYKHSEGLWGELDSGTELIAVVGDLNENPTSAALDPRISGSATRIAVREFDQLRVAAAESDHFWRRLPQLVCSRNAPSQSLPVLSPSAHEEDHWPIDRCPRSVGCPGRSRSQYLLPGSPPCEARCAAEVGATPTRSMSPGARLDHLAARRLHQAAALGDAQGLSVASGSRRWCRPLVGWPLAMLTGPMFSSSVVATRSLVGTGGPSLPG